MYLKYQTQEFQTWHDRVTAKGHSKDFCEQGIKAEQKSCYIQLESCPTWGIWCFYMPVWSSSLAGTHSFPVFPFPFEGEPDAVVLPEAHILGWVLQDMGMPTLWQCLSACGCNWLLLAFYPQKIQTRAVGGLQLSQMGHPFCGLCAAGFCWRRSRLRSNLSGAQMLWWAISLEMTS